MSGVRIAVILFVAVSSAAVTFLAVNRALNDEIPDSVRLGVYLGLLFSVWVAMFLQLILHEVGHLLAGLLSGYRFCSFRILQWTWVRTDGKTHLRRYELPGTAGQCLMLPPDPVNDRIPVGLYNMGGALMNLLTGLPALILGVLLPDSIGAAVLLMFGGYGLIFAIQNGVPMRLGLVDNDGRNAMVLGHNREAMRAFWIQLKINERQQNGERLSDMPDWYFAVPSDESMKNSMVAVVGVLASVRLVEAGQFAEADRLIAHLLEIDSGIVDLHRRLMICDRMYIELITANRRPVVESMRTPAQLKLMKMMQQSYPAVIRTAYAYTLLAEGNAANAQTLMQRMEQIMRCYPYAAEAQSEWSLMQYAAQVYAYRNGMVHS